MSKSNSPKCSNCKRREAKGCPAKDGRACADWALSPLKDPRRHRTNAAFRIPR